MVGDGSVTPPTDDPVDAVVSTVAAVAPDVRGSLPGRRRTTDGTNPSGDTVMAADRHADELFLEAIATIDGVVEYASEEREAVVDVSGGASENTDDDGDAGGNTDSHDGGLSVALDPLDGSSNLQSNNAMGTVLGVYDEPLPAPGSALVAAGYVLYGPITTFTVAREGTVTEYLIEGGELTAVEEDLTLPEEPSVYGFGGRVPDWPADFAEFAQAVESDPSNKLRYGGAMIADVNQVLTYGGIFAYPALESAERGKLRLQFEGAPIAKVIEAAGGASSDGERSLLEVEPESLHQRVPVHVGTESMIERLEARLG